MVNENVNVENGQCMPRLCECVLKMVNENAMVKLLMKMPRLVNVENGQCRCLSSRNITSLSQVM
jgi:hypothetical protein